MRGVGDGHLWGKRHAGQMLALGARAWLPGSSAWLSAAARVWERPPRPTKPGFQQNSIKLGESAQSPRTLAWRGLEPGRCLLAGVVGRWLACAGAAVQDRPWCQSLPLTDTTDGRVRCRLRALCPRRVQSGGRSLSLHFAVSVWPGAPAAASVSAELWTCRPRG